MELVVNGHHYNMNKLTILLLLLLNTTAIYSQNVGDTVISVIDTINIHGKVVNETGRPIFNALIISRTYDEKFQYRSAKTDRDGHFKLNGIKPIDYLSIITENKTHQLTNQGSRYLLIKVLAPSSIALMPLNTQLLITAKKINNKPKIELKQTTRIFYYDEDLYETPSMYPGGFGKFYNYLNSNLSYPPLAVQHHIEGNVKLAFIVDGDGSVKNVTIVNDIGYGCSEAIIKLLMQSKKWNPAMLHGKPIATNYTLEVPFKLLDK